MTGEPVLVLGATGRHGNTGAHLVSRLRQEGRAVRALVRATGPRTDALAKLGAEIVVGDLHDRRTLVTALTDVMSAYFTYPVAAGIVDAAANYAAAVRDTGSAARTVVMSMGPAHPQSPSGLGRSQWLAEQVLQWAGVEVVILRVAALFHENLKLLHARSIATERSFRNSFGTQQVAWISGQDAAELAVAALLDPRRFAGQVVHVPGPEQFSHPEIAEKLSVMLGVPVEFDPVSKDRWRQELENLDVPGVNSAMAQHISELGHIVSRSGPTVPADPQALMWYTGSVPVSLDDFLRANATEFGGSAR
ncbi:NmrA family NAD(P)-binding protein [Mycolicibacterium poriferae]|uniref:NmrA family NAD(P)-binding protein n=1 Tax=Mycolicibacterium poriferae TaxID=39694 RepID=UPI0024BA1016|nr:NmrA family NAD(P)-binding protein [Mycolicibacterium poriferae]